MKNSNSRTTIDKSYKTFSINIEKRIILSIEIYKIYLKDY